MGGMGGGVWCHPHGGAARRRAAIADRRTTHERVALLGRVPPAWQAVPCVHVQCRNGPPRGVGCVCSRRCCPPPLPAAHHPSHHLRAVLVRGADLLRAGLQPPRARPAAAQQRALLAAAGAAAAGRPALAPLGRVTRGCAAGC